MLTCSLTSQVFRRKNHLGRHKWNQIKNMKWHKFVIDVRTRSCEERKMYLAGSKFGVECHVKPWPPSILVVQALAITGAAMAAGQQCRISLQCQCQLAPVLRVHTSVCSLYIAPLKRAHSIYCQSNLFHTPTIFPRCQFIFSILARRIMWLEMPIGVMLHILYYHHDWQDCLKYMSGFS